MLLSLFALHVVAADDLLHARRREAVVYYMLWTAALGVVVGSQACRQQEEFH